MMHRWSNVVVRDRWCLYNVRWSSVISEHGVLFDVFAHTQPCHRTQPKFSDIASDAEWCDRNYFVNRCPANRKSFGVRLSTTALVGCVLKVCVGDWDDCSTTSTSVSVSWFRHGTMRSTWTICLRPEAMSLSSTTIGDYQASIRWLPGDVP